MTIRCQDAAGRIQERLDGRLSAEAATALDAHLSVCAGCRDQARLLGWIDERLRCPTPGAPADFADRILQRIGDRGVPSTPRRRPSSGPAWRLIPALVGLPAAAAIVAFALLRSPQAPPPAPSASVEAPRVQVELELAKSDARSVAVAGDFNGWEANAAKMTRGDDGIWRIRLELPPGRYQYVFVVDDDRWIADPQAATVVDSGFSGTNSVLDVSL